MNFLTCTINDFSLGLGEPFSVCVSADYEAGRDYEVELDPPGSTIGSTVAKWLWGNLKYGGWPIKMIPEKYRKLQYSDIPTLMVNGNVDFATPLVYAKKLLPFLRNGKLVVLKEMGHIGDVAGLQRDAFRHLVRTFFLKGIVDDSKFKYQPMNFKPSKTFQEMAKELVSKAKEK